MLSIGGTVCLLSGLVALAYLDDSRVCSSNYDGGYGCRNNDSEATTFGVIALGGAALGVVGAVSLGNALGERRELGKEIQKLQRQREGLAHGVTYDVEATKDRAGLRLRIAF
jgi:hypothetical protein